MAGKKSAEEIASEQRRYALARSAMTEEDFEPFFTDSNQAIRNEAAANPAATGRVLDRFAADRFWSVRVAVAEHKNTELHTLLKLLESNPRRRGVVHDVARRRLEAEGVEFGPDGLPVR